MNNLLSRSLTLLCFLSICVLWCNAHVRLVNPTNGMPLIWSHPQAIEVVLSSRAAGDLSLAEQETALRNALDTWNRVAGTAAHLVEELSPEQRARTDFASTDLHLIAFDEDNSSGYFPAGSGIVALTPISFLADGKIIDADILFNGAYSFSTKGEHGRFDLQDVATHELGHLLGLDHSPWASGSMYPFADTAVLLHRSLALDEAHALVQAYPLAQGAALSAVLRRADAQPLRGAHVVLRDERGRPVASTLSDSHGALTISGLAPGTYQLYAAPVDHPVGAMHLGAGHEIEVDFGATEFGSFDLSGSSELDLGDMQVAPDCQLSLGRIADHYPMHLVQGVSRALVIRGYDLHPGCTLEPSDSRLELSNPVWTSTAVSFEALAPADFEAGHVDLRVRNAAGEVSILTAAIEVTPPKPSVSLIQPATGSVHGGRALTIVGTHFRSGCRVVLGDQIYVEGEVGGCVLIDSTHLRLTTRPSIGGTQDVVVIGASGLEGRLSAGFEFTGQPTIQMVFPAAGFRRGGTEVRLTGMGFTPGSKVFIDGIEQLEIVWESEEHLHFVTAPVDESGVCTLEFELPGGLSATSSFHFIGDPDPGIAAVTPREGPVSGGQLVTIHGANFKENTEVVFGVNAETGTGGTRVEHVTFIDEHTMQVVTPSLSTGLKSVLVRDTSTQQAATLEDAFTYASKPPGGSCVAQINTGPQSLVQLMSQALWLLLLTALAVARSRKVARMPRPALQSAGGAE